MRRRTLVIQCLKDGFSNKARAKRHHIPGYVRHIEMGITLLGFRVKGREVLVGDKGYQLREGLTLHKALLGVENDDSGLENTYFWHVKPK